MHILVWASYAFNVYAVRNEFQNVFAGLRLNRVLVHETADNEQRQTNIFNLKQSTLYTYGPRNALKMDRINLMLSGVCAP